MISKETLAVELMEMWARKKAEIARLTEELKTARREYDEIVSEMESRVNRPLPGTIEPELETATVGKRRSR